MKLKDFLRKKDVVISYDRYLIGALSNMAMGLSASLLIGTILKSFGTNFEIKFLTEKVAPLAMSMTGASIGVAVAYALKSPPLVLFASTITGMAGNAAGGPVGAFVAVVIGAEFGKIVSKETKIDIIITPAITIIFGILAGGAVGPTIAKIMWSFGELIMYATELQPFYMGIIISVVVGMVLTLPISSAALCMMLNLGGLAGGAATVGCCCQMIGFAVMSFRENGWGGIAAQGIGTSMLQISNIIKNWKIWIPPTLTSAILGPVSTIIFKMENSPIGAGMGTSGFVGQIATISTMTGKGKSGISLYITIILIHFVLPAIITLIIAEIMRKRKLIKDGDLKLNL